MSCHWVWRHLNWLWWCSSAWGSHLHGISNGSNSRLEAKRPPENLWSNLLHLTMHRKFFVIHWAQPGCSTFPAHPHVHKIRCYHDLTTCNTKFWEHSTHRNPWSNQLKEAFLTDFGNRLKAVKGTTPESVSLETTGKCHPFLNNERVNSTNYVTMSVCLIVNIFLFTMKQSN